MAEQRTEITTPGGVVIEVEETEQTACACCDTVPCQRTPAEQRRAAREQEALSAAGPFFDRLAAWWRRRRR